MFEPAAALATVFPELAYLPKTKAFRPSMRGKLSTCEEWGVGDILYLGERWERRCAERLHKTEVFERQ